MTLYSAQLAAHSAVQTRWLPTNWASAYDTSCDKIAAVSNRASETLLGMQYIRRFVDSIYGVNPINNQRHLVLVPRNIEKFLGKWVFYPITTLGFIKDTDKNVDAIFEQLLETNRELLNPSDEDTQFDYQIQTIDSGQVNAFATPGGGMVVFTGIIDSLRRSIENKKITHAAVQTADGREALVDLSDVTLEDTLAALIGHEMTHVASRHSMAGMTIKFLLTVILSVGRYALVQYLKASDEEYKALSQITNLTDGEKQRLKDKEASYKRLSSLFEWIQDKAEGLSHLFHSRTNEYEADVTGAYLAQRAGYNPLGAIYLQEFLTRREGDLMGWFHKNCEFMFTHPHGENRKRALHAAIQHLTVSQPR